MLDFNVTQKDLAKVLSITTRQVRNLKNQGLFETEPGTKKYNLAKCVAEYIDFKIKGEVSNGTSVIKEKEQAEHERIKKEISKIKLRKLKKEMHEASDVEYFLNNMLVAFRNRLLAVPGKVAPVILGETDINIVIEKLTSEMFETLDELSEYDPDAVNGDGISDDMSGDENDDEDD